ncbi:hypothetical protein [Nocardia fluminea]|uniref:hypothetical protein n=1 Tax=Nocardia fluminea TaxID=134984 RepID=UPI0033C80DB9
MKRGMITESHVVIYCDTCGDVLTDADGESICFDSTNQAVSFLGADRASGWGYDGDRITCFTCIAAAECAATGHEFPESIWPYVDDDLTCYGCGITKSELTQEN